MQACHPFGHRQFPQHPFGPFAGAHDSNVAGGGGQQKPEQRQVMSVIVRHQERHRPRRDADVRPDVFGAREGDPVGDGKPGTADRTGLRIDYFYLPAQFTRELDDRQRVLPGPEDDEGDGWRKRFKAGGSRRRAARPARARCRRSRARAPRPPRRSWWRCCTRRASPRPFKWRASRARRRRFRGSRR